MQLTASVYVYSCEVLRLGLLFLEFKDFIRRGDEGCDLIQCFGNISCCYSKPQNEPAISFKD